MASTIRVTTTILKSKAEELRNMNAKFKQEVEGLSESEGTLAGMWEGEAQKIFHTQFQTDKGKFDAFYNGIEKYVERLLETANSYDRAEAEASNIAQTRKA